MFDRRAYPVPLPLPVPVDRAAAQPVPPTRQAAPLPPPPPQWNPMQQAAQAKQSWQQRMRAGYRSMPAAPAQPVGQQRGMPIPSRANLTGNQMNTWQQRMSGRQGAAVTNGQPMKSPPKVTMGQPAQSPQTNPTPNFLPRGQ